jgi:regulator of sirC expression with transglutaminase-like and TPR domain
MTDTEIRKFASEHVTDTDFLVQLKNAFPQNSLEYMINVLSFNPYEDFVREMRIESRRQRDQEELKNLEDNLQSTFMNNEDVKMARAYAKMARNLLPLFKEDLKPWTDFLVDLIAERLEERRVSQTESSVAEPELPSARSILKKNYSLF